LKMIIISLFLYNF